VIPEVTVDRLMQYEGWALVYLLHKSDILKPSDLPYLESPIEAVWYRCMQGECWYIFPVSVVTEEVVVGKLFKRLAKRVRVKPSSVPNDRARLPRGVPYFEPIGDSLNGSWYRVDADPDNVRSVEVRGRWLILDVLDAKVGVRLPCELKGVYMCKDGDENPFTCFNFFYVECAEKVAQGL